MIRLAVCGATYVARGLGGRSRLIPDEVTQAAANGQIVVTAVMLLRRASLLRSAGFYESKQTQHA